MYRKDPNKSEKVPSVCLSVKAGVSIQPAYRALTWHLATALCSLCQSIILSKSNHTADCNAHCSFINMAVRRWHWWVTIFFFFQSVFAIWTRWKPCASCCNGIMVQCNCCTVLNCRLWRMAVLHWLAPRTDYCCPPRPPAHLIQLKWSIMN